MILISKFRQMYVCIDIWVRIYSYTPNQPLPPVSIVEPAKSALSNEVNCMRHGLRHFLGMPHNEEIVRLQESATHYFSLYRSVCVPTYIHACVLFCVIVCVIKRKTR